MYKQPTAIIAADIHLREDVPLCRTDDYFQAQSRKVRWLRKLRKDLNCPVIVAGDVFDHWKPSPFLLGWAIKSLPPFLAIPGQHDLPQHRLGLLPKSGFYVLKAAKKLWLLKGPKKARRRPGTRDPIKGPFPALSDCIQATTGLHGVVYGYAYGEKLRDPDEIPGRSVAIAHRLTWKNVLPYPGCAADSALDLLKKHPYDLIVTGDNHKPFVVKHQGRLLVNPGSMMRMDADQVEHRPRVYLWYAKSNSVERVYYPIEKGVVSREHITDQKKQEEQFQVLVQRLQEVDSELGLSYSRNVKRYLRKHRTRKEVIDIIWEAMP